MKYRVQHYRKTYKYLVDIDSRSVSMPASKSSKALYRLVIDFRLADWVRKMALEYKGRKCGTMGDAGCFSFHPRKAITTGEGGMVVTDDKNIALLH